MGIPNLCFGSKINKLKKKKKKNRYSPGNLSFAIQNLGSIGYMAVLITWTYLDVKEEL